MTFRNEANKRNWFAAKDAPCSHLLMDGGRLSIPDDQAAVFLNIYFSSVVIRQEKLSVVEVKTPTFRLFFDLDIRFKKDAHAIHRAIHKLCRIVWEHCTSDFFDLHTEAPCATSSVSSLSTMETDASSTCQTGVSSSPAFRMIACYAPPKIEENGSIKHGVHIVFPHIFVNAPIALACREALLAKIDHLFDDGTRMHSQGDAASDNSAEASVESTASTSGYPTPTNSWSDILDDSVFRANGLRMVYSGKGKSEGRAYVPKYEILDMRGDMVPCDVSTAVLKRQYVHDTSIRVFHHSLTPCLGGEHEIADSPTTHNQGGLVTGKSTPIDMFSEALPKLREVLPSVYKDCRFMNAFVTTHAVMIKTNSRYCHNKGGEHRTSTIYLCVTKKGVCQRCYCRKEERGCADFASPIIPLDSDTVRVFFPDTFLDDPDEEVKKSMVLPTTRRKTSTLQNVLKRSRFHAKPSKKKSKAR